MSRGHGWRRQRNQPLWNHNLHYGRRLLSELPPRCRRMLDVGCGDGSLTAELASRATEVVGIDVDDTIIAVAREQNAAPGVGYVVGDVLTYPFEPEGFDAVVCVAALHHLDPSRALPRLRDLLGPGGVLIVVGLARSTRVLDFAADATGVLMQRPYIFTHGYREQRAATLPPARSYKEMGSLAGQFLPGARFRRELMFRYSLVWQKPG